MTSITGALKTAFAIALVGVLASMTLVSVVSAQTPTGQLTVVTNISGSGTTPGNPFITVNASSVGLGGTTGNSNTYSYSPNWGNSTTFTMLPGSYAVTVAQMNGVPMALSNDCFGNMTAGSSRTCTITANYNSYGQLTVYVNVINNNGGNRVASDFTVGISGNNPSATSFQGVAGGRTVTIQPGSYSVSVSGDYGYSKSYSGDCSASINNGQTRSCTITLDDTSSFYGDPGYPTNLTCSPSRQSAYVGQSISFVAQGGAGIYNWVVGGRTYVNRGPSATFVVESGAHPQSVTVSSGYQTATCYIDIIGAPAYTYPTTGGGQVKGVYVAPGLPYTGEGGDAARTISLILGWLVVFPAALYFSYRFGRKAFASISSSDLT